MTFNTLSVSRKRQNSRQMAARATGSRAASPPGPRRRDAVSIDNTQSAYDYRPVLQPSTCRPPPPRAVPPCAPYRPGRRGGGPRRGARRAERAPRARPPAPPAPRAPLPRVARRAPIRQRHQLDHGVKRVAAAHAAAVEPARPPCPPPCCCDWPPRPAADPRRGPAASRLLPELYDAAVGLLERERVVDACLRLVP